MLHLASGSVSVARYYACARCDRRGIMPGGGESLRSVNAWAKDVGFAWPGEERRRPSPAAISGVIETRDSQVSRPALLEAQVG
jgi:hypothetical protein